MNDRYLFRAKRTDNGEWMEGYYLFCPIQADNKPSLENFTYKHWIVTHNGNPFEVDPSTISQCSGVYDKNKKTIFEKDIVNDEDGSIGIVEYGLYAYYHIGFFVRWLNKEAEYYRNELGYWADKVECIGSSIDNPELFEVGE